MMSRCRKKYFRDNGGTISLTSVCSRNVATLGKAVSWLPTYAINVLKNFHFSDSGFSLLIISNQILFVKQI